MESSTYVFPPFYDSDFHAKVIDRFLFIEAEVMIGIKGENLTTFKFKTCRKLRKNVDISKLKVFYSQDVLRITTNDTICLYEKELFIDKRQAEKNDIPKQNFVSGDNGNYERFISGLKAI